MKRAIALVLVGLVMVMLASCTPQQVRDYAAWHSADPAAAETWLATPDGQATLDDQVSATRSTSVWDRIAWCESGGQWNHPPVHNRHGSFSGGLMIQSTVWDHYGGGQFASDAWLATRAEQIAIAERIAGDVGLARAWQCA